MKVLVIGSGGREHALAIAIKKSPLLTELICAPGNPGMLDLGKNINVAADDIAGLLKLVQAEKVDFVVVGPEVPLVLGLVDELEKLGIPAFGPSAAAAQLEGSKAFSKDIMAKYGIPTARYKNFTDLASAKEFALSLGAPLVVKASGLAAGKGAIVCETMDQALVALEDMLGEKAIFGESGKVVVIEEFMVGEEASIFAVCDGNDYLVLSSAQDHKRIYDGDLGPNTGGMGAYAPAPVATPEILEIVKKTIIEPTLQGMKQEGAPYKGVLYVGIMATDIGPRVVEYNVRFGDPECQIILPLVDGDVLDLLHKCALGRIKEFQFVESKKAASIVVLASLGYPNQYEKHKVVSGSDSVVTDAHLIHAGTQLIDGKLVTNGGRVFGAVGFGKDLQTALDRSYELVQKVQYEGKTFRTDIGQKGLAYNK
jgi:phosphoribosylamine--glycine ligase